MSDASTVRAFLEGEVEALEPFGFLAVHPSGEPLHVLEVTRGEDRALEVRVPGRPPVVPELDPAVRRRLRERGFASEAPADATRPWVRTVEGAAAAVELLLQLFVEVFEHKPDAPLDVAHGSHREEHEARQRLAKVRERIEPLLAEIAGQTPEQDADGDYVMPIQDVHVTVAPRVAPGGPVVLRVFAITNVGFQVAPELGIFLARLNFGMMFGRFALDTEHRAIWFDETLLGDRFRDEELRFVIDVVASTADQWDDRLKQMFGGATYQEVLNGRTGESAPTTKPGLGGYV